MVRAVLNTGGCRQSPQPKADSQTIAPDPAIVHTTPQDRRQAQGLLSPLASTFGLTRIRQRYRYRLYAPLPTFIPPFGCGLANPSLSRCESWRAHGYALGFAAATLQRKYFPLHYAHSSRYPKYLRFQVLHYVSTASGVAPPIPRRPVHNKDALARP